jgi:lysophospholipase L1-like esterase
LKSKLLLICFGVVAAFSIAEITLRMVAKFNPPGRYVYPPNHTFYFHPDASILIGISGAKEFKTNAQGFRGDEDFTDSTYNILCVGGSTTECNYLDNKETWFSLLNQSPDIARLIGASPKRVVIASVGLSGQTSFENYFMLNELLQKHKNIHHVILMCGINDFVKVLAKPTLNISVEKQKDSLFQAHLISRYWYIPGRINDTTWTGHSALMHSIRANFFSTPSKNTIDRRGEIVKQWRANYSSRSKLLDTLPDLTASLEVFNKNLEQIFSLCATHRVKLVCINQATLWHDTLPGNLSNLLWMGGIGKYQTQKGGVYYSPKALQSGMEMYNTTLAKTAKAYNILCIDIAHRLSKDTSVFYDDCHFNTSGARKVADEIVRQLKSVNP